MARRSTIYSLDEATRAELDRRIVGAGFGGYAEHAAWIAGQGHALSVSAIQRYGKRLRRRVERDQARTLEATAAVAARVRHAGEVARAIYDAAGDDPLALPERTAELLMARFYEIATEENIDARTLQTVARSLSDSLKAVAAIRGERDESRQKARKDDGMGFDLRAATFAAIEANIQQSPAKREEAARHILSALDNAIARRMNLQNSMAGRCPRQARKEHRAWQDGLPNPNGK